MSIRKKWKEYNIIHLVHGYLSVHVLHFRHDYVLSGILENVNIVVKFPHF